MVFSSILGTAALALVYLVAPATAAENLPLPWDGRAFDLKDVSEKYLTHILTMRNNGTDGVVSDYVSIDNNGRSPAYNGDTGVISIGADAKAIFKVQKNFRRSELVQFVEMNTEGKTYFRTSMMKKKHFLNRFQWQLIFTETHVFEIRVDATFEEPMLIYLNNGTWDPKWETKFEPGTWYNFVFAISAAPGGTLVEFYMSEGDAEPELTRTHITVTPYITSEECHFGLLTLSDDGSEPKMVEEQDIVLYNGVSVEADWSSCSLSDRADDDATQMEKAGGDDATQMGDTPSPYKPAPRKKGDKMQKDPPAPENPASDTPDDATPNDDTPTPGPYIPAPAIPGRVTPAPVTPAPVTPAPVTPPGVVKPADRRQ